MIFWFCLGFVSLTPAGTTLFQEDFESPIHLAGALTAADGDWVTLGGTGDTVGSPGWQQASDGMGYQSQGYMFVTPFDQSDRCITKRKVLYTPAIDPQGNTGLTITYWIRHSGGDRPPPEFVLVNAQGDRLQLPSPAVVRQFKTQQDDWMQMEVELSNLSGGPFRHGISFTSSASQCDAMSLDKVSVTANCPRPDAVIVEPPEIGGPINVPIGVPVPMRAASRDGNNDGLTFLWQVRVEVNSDPIFSTEGEAVEIVFDQPGEYIVTCTAINDCGETDTIPAFRRFIAAQDVGLDTVITEPAEDLIRATRGEEITFRAQAVAGKQRSIEFFWIVEKDQADRNRQEYRGDMVRIRFEDAGRYLVLCSAKDGPFLDPVPAFRVVEVAPVQARIIEPKPDRGRREVYAQVGVPVSFRASLEDPTGLVSTFGWIQQPGGHVLCEGNLECEISFDAKGVYGVVFGGKSADGQSFGDLIYAIVDVPLYTAITMPEAGDELAVGMNFSLTAEVLGDLAADPGTKAAWILRGQEFMVDPNHTRFETMAPPEPGTYQVRFIAYNPARGETHESRLDISVYDPNSQGNPEIIRPIANQTIPAGGKLFFDSSFRNTRRDERGALWQICNAEGTVIGNAYAATLGRVAFPDEGIFEVKLFLRGSGGDRLVDSRTITVGSPNLDPTGSPIAIDYGHYDNLTLSQEHVFAIQVPADGQSVTFNIAVEGTATFQLANAAQPETILISRNIEGQVTFSAGRLDSGTYHWTLKPAPGKVGISYSFGIEVLNPALYFPDIVEDGSNRTTVAMVNTTDGAADVELIAYDKDGNILAKLPKTIPARGSLKDRIANLFGDISAEISWLRVDATRDLVGFSQVIDIAGTRAYAVSGATYLEPELSIPHIAKDTATWYTRANVANGMPETIEATLEAGDTSAELALGASHAKDAFDFLDKFDGSIPQTTNFGTFLDKDGRASLAGNEVFGLHAKAQVVGLGLAGSPRDNPNFNTLTNNIYFSHIADVTQFWTAVALVNLGDYPQGIAVKAYGPGGALIDSAGYQLQANEKLALLAADFYALIGLQASGAEWLEIQADGNVTGYELFGNYDDKLMAGLEAITEVKQKICMPFIDGTGAYVHGIAVVNVSETASGVTFNIHDESGGLAASVTLTEKLAPKQKRIFVLEQLFAGLPLSGSWLEVDSEQGIVGFELFIGSDSEHMSGLVAQ